MIKKSVASNKNILVVPLNWGLGHATRLIPVIRKLGEYPVNIIVGGSPAHQKIISEAVTGIQFIHFPYLKFKLNGKRSQIFSVAFQLPKFILHIWREHHYLNKLVKHKSIDVIISDNCYGLWHSRIPTVIITHQLNIKLPHKLKFIEGLVNRLNHRFLSKFSECWIPDFSDGMSLAGKLSENPDNVKNYKYIGPLSRFERPKEPIINRNNQKNLLVLISGPEKQRTYFEKKIRSEIEKLPANWSVNVVRGVPQTTVQINSRWYNYANTAMLQTLISEADCIICRAGYSTIMDLYKLRKTAILVPTPGQTEQKYLARYLAKKGLFSYVPENLLSIPNCLKEFDKAKSHTPTDTSDDLLNKAIKQLAIRLNS